MTPRLHTAIIGAKGRIFIDGIEHIVLEDNPEPAIETIAPGIHTLKVGIICKEIHLECDEPHNFEPTPLYDQLLKEQENA